MPRVYAPQQVGRRRRKRRGQGEEQLAASLAAALLQPPGGASEVQQRLARGAAGGTTLLGLQRTHGNAFVQRALIQRLPQLAVSYRDDVPLGERLYGGDWPGTLFELQDDGSNSATRARLNANGRALLDEYGRLLRLQVDWGNAAGFVEQHRSTGQAALGQVEGAAAAIGGAAKGARGAYRRAGMEDYLAAIHAADRQAREIGAKLKAVDVAAGGLKTAVLGQVRLGQERAVEQKQGEVNEAQQRVEHYKNRIGSFMGFAVSLVKPESWVSMGVAAVACLGEEVMEENVPQGELVRLKAELEQAKTSLRQIEDAEQLAKIETAAADVQRAATELDNARKDFRDLYQTIRLKETTVVETLGGSGATRGAAGAIAERGAVVDAALRAEERIKRYLDETDPFIGQMEKVAGFYRGYLHIVQGAAGIDPEYARHLMYVSGTNAAAIDKLKQWVEGMRALGRARLDFLAKREYLAGYEQIPAALQTALTERNAPVGGR